MSKKVLVKDMNPVQRAAHEKRKRRNARRKREVRAGGWK